jgi:hypothetical protein
MGHMKTNIEHGIYNIDHPILYRQIVEVVTDWFLDKYLRDFLATLMHELVHVLQWERGEWEDDGEKEAEDKQYELADEFWKEGLIR